MRAPLIAGNWKMNGLLGDARALAEGLRAAVGQDATPEILVCPPFLALAAAAEILKGTRIRIGAQNMSWEAKGAFTGEISPLMLKEVGVTHVLLGHSERRHILGETHEFINKKTKAALAHALTPVVCVGELLEERNCGDTNNVIDRQITKGLDGLSAEDMARIVVAYEPVWAIGTGKTASPRQAADVHHFIRKTVSKKWGEATAEGLRILYGGSVTPENVKELMAEADIDGALVGGASLKADSFAKIVRYKA
jgi:triosephosphate isomerase (TIM)